MTSQYQFGAVDAHGTAIRAGAASPGPGQQAIVGDARPLGTSGAESVTETLSGK
jgi:hypothetical protein